MDRYSGTKLSSEVKSVDSTFEVRHRVPPILYTTYYERGESYLRPNQNFTNGKPRRRILVSDRNKNGSTLVKNKG